MVGFFGRKRNFGGLSGQRHGESAEIGHAISEARADDVEKARTPGSGMPGRAAAIRPRRVVGPHSKNSKGARFEPSALADLNCKL
jgi:hypothetical protein